MKRTVIFIILALFSLSGCGTAQEASSSLATPVELGTPTIVIIPPDATEMTPTETPTPLPPTPEPLEINLDEAIDISTPFAGASVTSPLTVFGTAGATFEQTLVIRMVGLDNVELGKTTTTIQADGGQRGSFNATIDFTAGDNQNALLQIYSTSARDGSLVHLNSVMVKLVPQEKEPEDFNTGLEAIQISNVKIIQNAGKLELVADGLASGASGNMLQYKMCADLSGSGDSDLICGSTAYIMNAGLVEVVTEEGATTGTWSITAQLQHGNWRTGSLVVYNASAANGEVQHAASEAIKNGP
jgi:hypothetical protein